MSGEYRTWNPTATMRRPAAVADDDQETRPRRSQHLGGRTVRQQQPATKAYGGGEYGSRRTADDVAARAMLGADDNESERSVHGRSFSKGSAHSMTSPMKEASADPMANLPPEAVEAMKEIQSQITGLMSGIGQSGAGETIARAVMGEVAKVACWSLWDLTYKPENQKVAGLICRILYIVASILTFGALSIIDQTIQAIRRQIFISNNGNLYGLVFGNIKGLIEA